MADMLDKTVVITGATSGIGAVAADHLAQTGARIVFVARDRERAAATLKHLNAIAGHIPHEAFYADLSKLSEMKRVGEEIAHAHPRIDVLINNAGAMFGKRQLSADGLEMTFAVNHLAYFVLTNILLPNLKATAPARIVSTASRMHRTATLDFSDLQMERRYSPWTAYSRSKLMNILFTRELAKRLSGTKVTANSLHPGFVATRFGQGNRGGMMNFVMGLARNLAITPEEGAQTIIYLASSPEVEGVNGKYFSQCKEEEPSKAARSDADAARLWEITAKIAGLGA